MRVRRHRSHQRPRYRGHCPHRSHAAGPPSPPGGGSALRWPAPARANAALPRSGRRSGVSGPGRDGCGDRGDASPAYPARAGPRLRSGGVTSAQNAVPLRGGHQAGPWLSNPPPHARRPPTPERFLPSAGMNQPLKIRTVRQLSERPDTGLNGCSGGDNRRRDWSACSRQGMRALDETPPGARFDRGRDFHAGLELGHAGCSARPGRQLRQCRAQGPSCRGGRPPVSSRARAEPGRCRVMCTVCLNDRVGPPRGCGGAAAPAAR